MDDSRDHKRKPEARRPNDAPSTPDRGAGRIVHDERGNAVWNWVKETGRSAVDSTSAMLKKLEIADLKIADHKDTAVLPDDSTGRDAGGGYDPYNQKMPAKKPPTKPPKKL